MTGHLKPSRADQAEAISQETTQIHAQSYEQEPDSVETVVDGDLVASVLRFTLSAAEEAVVAIGQGDTVKAGRHESQLVLESVLRAAVERATGRTVTAFVTQTYLAEQGIVIEVYTLSPAQTAA